MEWPQLVGLVTVGFVLGVVLVVAALFLLGRWWLRRKLAGLAEQVAQSLGTGAGDGFGSFPVVIPPAPRLRLRPLDDAAWSDDVAVDEATDALLDRGFVLIGDFDPEGMPGLQIRAFHDPRGRYYAAVYEHAMGGHVFVDLHARLADASTLTVTSVPMGEEIRTPTTHHKISLPNASPAELRERMESELSGRLAEAATSDGFVAEFESAYAQSMDFHLARGGPSLEEMRRGMELRGEEIDEPTLQAAHENSREMYALALENFLHDQIEADGASDHLIIVHDNQSLDRVISLALEAGSDDEVDDPDKRERLEAEARRLVEGMAPREAFARLTRDLPPGKRLRRVATFDNPVPADAYGPEPAST